MGQEINGVGSKGTVLVMMLNGQGQDVNWVRRESRIRMLTGLGQKGKSGQDVKGVRSGERVSGYVSVQSLQSPCL